MAKRKRLSLNQADKIVEPGASPKTGLSPSMIRAPIAHIAGDAATSAALEEVTIAFQAARETGRLLLELPIADIEADHLIQDRMASDDEDMQSLMQSLKQRGQQTPIEVLEIEAGRYGLISGWRRLQALTRLNVPIVLAVVRQPENAADAYLAMVEENEIRVGLSYFERARIAAKAGELGLYASSTQAVQALFANASRAKRSKIKSFVTLYNVLGETLRFPAAISERLGLALVSALDRDATLAQRLRDRLRKTERETPEQETGLLQGVLAEKQTPAQKKQKERVEVNKGVWLESKSTQQGLTLTLSGQGITPQMKDQLERWLREM